MARRRGAGRRDKESTSLAGEAIGAYRGDGSSSRGEDDGDAGAHGTTVARPRVGAVVCRGEARSPAQRLELTRMKGLTVLNIMIKFILHICSTLN